MLRRLGALRQLAGLPCWSPASAAPRAASTLSYEVVEASASAGAAVAAAAPPVRTAFLLHGLLGQGRNWRTFARRLVAAAAEAGAPNWRLLLVDLRCHGQTAVRGEFRPPQPHTLAAAARDLEALAAAVGAPQLLLGHSMGGKVALQYAAAHAADAPASVWALDSVPGPVAGDPHAVGAVLDAVASLPAEIPSRAWLADNLRGRVPSATAAWLASALIPVPGAPPTGPLRTGFDLQGARQMYESYKETDLWDTFVSPPPGVDVRLVRAGRSASWGGAVADRLAALPPDASARILTLPDASHWLHVDKPDELLAMLLPAFTAPPR